MHIIFLYCPINQKISVVQNFIHSSLFKFYKIDLKINKNGENKAFISMKKYRLHGTSKERNMV